eukprot:2191509-Alexandrium_andersonii.AAC.1
MYDVTFDKASSGDRTEWLDLVVETTDTQDACLTYDAVCKPVVIPPAWDRDSTTLRCYLISRVLRWHEMTLALLKIRRQVARIFAASLASDWCLQHWWSVSYFLPYARP